MSDDEKHKKNNNLEDDDKDKNKNNSPVGDEKLKKNNSLELAYERKYKEKLVDDLKRRLGRGESYKEIGMAYNSSQHTVRKYAQKNNLTNSTRGKKNDEPTYFKPDILSKKWG
ncbi:MULTISPECIES: hypothetical protein [Cysteiniphilum]|nr:MULTISPECIES: hypothetical protein [Cysteiniphilum]